MRRINAFKEYFEKTTRRYNDGDEITVEWGSQPHVAYDKSGEPVIRLAPNVRDWLGRDLSEEQEFRCILDDLNHEVEHPRRTPPNAKKEFMEAYPETPNLAGQVMNIYEDVYIDRKRTDRWKGLRQARAFVIDKVMENSHRHGRVDNMDDENEQLIEGLFQVTHAGYVKGVDNLDKDKQQFFAWLRSKAEEIQTIGGFEEDANIDSPQVAGDGYYDKREAIMHDVMEELLDRLDIPERADEYAMEMSTPSGQLPDPDDLDIDSDNETDSETPESDMDSVDGQGDADDSEDTQDSEEAGDANNEDGASDDGDGSDEQQGDDENELGNQLDNADGTGDPTEADEQEAELDESGAADPLGDGDEAEDESGGLEALEDASVGVEMADASDDEEEPIEEADVETTEDEEEAPGQGDKLNGPVDDADELDAHVDAMRDLDEERKSGSWYDVGDTDYDRVGDRYQDRYNQLQRQKARDNTSTAEKRRKRDDLSEGTGERVKEKLRSSGLAEEVEEAFEQLITRDEWIPARKGQRLHKRNAIRHVSGDKTVRQVYQHKRRAEVGDRAVSVALDMSGSMGGRDEIKAKTALAALQKATDIIGDQFTACAYKTFSPQGTGKKVVTVPLITAPDEDFEFDHLDAVWASGTTPTPSGIVEASRLLDECTKREDVMFVITDGQPNVTSDGGGSPSAALEESRKLVRELKSEGVTVIGLGVGNISENQMEEMFEGQYITTDMDNLADKLVEVYREQMNTTDL